jgi:hypothetical protein
VTADVEVGQAEGAGRQLACPGAVWRPSCRSERSHPRTGRVRRKAAAEGARLGASVSVIVLRSARGNGKRRIRGLLQLRGQCDGRAVSVWLAEQFQIAEGSSSLWNIGNRGVTKTGAATPEPLSFLFARSPFVHRGDIAIVGSSRVLGTTLVSESYVRLLSLMEFLANTEASLEAHLRLASRQQVASVDARSIGNFARAKMTRRRPVPRKQRRFA